MNRNADYAQDLRQSVKGGLQRLEQSQAPESAFDSERRNQERLRRIKTRMRIKEPPKRKYRYQWMGDNQA